MRPAGHKPQPCNEPGCRAAGQVRVVGSSAWFCFSHKPVGAKIK